jgi:N-acetyl-gamma-glutamyl-phosphate reductase
MPYRIGVVGASGYTGAELLRLLAGHPEFEVVHVTAETNAGTPVGTLYPSLAIPYADLVYEAFDVSILGGLDVAFLALPHGTSQRIVPDLVDSVGHLVDLGADFRLPADLYSTWYGEAHAAPELLEGFAYGLPELARAQLTTCAHVAVPGCYPTTAALALAPALAAGLAEPRGIVVDALSGVSGRGRGLSAQSLYAEANENATAYGLLNHRHTGEIEFALALASSREVQVLFTPHLVPMTRGILATCYARPAVSGLTTERLLDEYRARYESEPFVSVSETPPSTKAALGSNACHVTVRYDPRTDTIVALGAIDNLVKGAAGQAIQSANAVLGLPESTGLSVVGIMP